MIEVYNLIGYAHIFGRTSIIFFLTAFLTANLSIATIDTALWTKVSRQQRTIQAADGVVSFAIPSRPTYLHKLQSLECADQKWSRAKDIEGIR